MTDEHRDDLDMNSNGLHARPNKDFKTLQDQLLLPLASLPRAAISAIALLNP